MDKAGGEVSAQGALAVGPSNVHAGEVLVGVAEPVQHLRAGVQSKPDPSPDSPGQPLPDVIAVTRVHGWVKVKCALKVVEAWRIRSSAM